MGERARARTAIPWRAGPFPISTTAGMLAARTWLTARGLSAPTLQRWHATVLMGPELRVPELDFDDRRETRFRIEIYSEEWGFFFCHQGRASWIRVTDIPFIHGHDDFRLLSVSPPLKDLGTFLRSLEAQHALQFQREHALVRTNLDAAEPTIRSWVLSL